jgi:hypothetical protein
MADGNRQRSDFSIVFSTSIEIPYAVFDNVLLPLRLPAVNALLLSDGGIV